ncbi:MAG: uracil-DNA glycosylase [Burkholderiales bacterium]
MNRREEFLQEMGLGPVWRRRQVKAAPAEVEPEPAAAPVETLETVPPVAASPAMGVSQLGWAELKSRVSECALCGLHSTRKQAVFGVGDERADWLFVGEAPGEEEDAKGEPFVGQAGRLLDNMLKSIGLQRGRQVYIANVLKCRPPGNRNPGPDEVACCKPYLQRQIELIQPKLIVTLGKFAAQTLLGQEASIASLRGTVHDYRGIPLVATYHPAYLLRKLTEKARAWEDLCLARQTMEDARRDKGAPS